MTWYSKKESGLEYLLQASYLLKRPDEELEWGMSLVLCRDPTNFEQELVNSMADDALYAELFGDHGRGHFDHRDIMRDFRRVWPLITLFVKYWRAERAFNLAINRSEITGLLLFETNPSALLFSNEDRHRRRQNK